MHAGSEAKVMLSKLRAQFDELRTKVEFLDSVRQYLKVGPERLVQLIKQKHSFLIYKEINSTINSCKLYLTALEDK